MQFAYILITQYMYICTLCKAFFARSQLFPHVVTAFCFRKEVKYFTYVIMANDNSDKIINMVVGMVKNYDTRMPITKYYAYSNNQMRVQ